MSFKKNFSFFLFSYLLGFAALWFGGTSNFEILPQNEMTPLWVAVFVAVLVFFYGYIIYRGIQKRFGKLENWNDTHRSEYRILLNSIYFLGFLFTLTGLFCALLASAKSVDSGADVNLPMIITSSAFALCSTIVAMIVRMYLNFKFAEQFCRSEPEDSVPSSKIPQNTTQPAIVPQEKDHQPVIVNVVNSNRAEGAPGTQRDVSTVQDYQPRRMPNRPIRT